MEEEDVVKRVFAILGVDVDSPASVEEFRQDLRFNRMVRTHVKNAVVVFYTSVFSALGLALVNLI